MIQPWSTNGLDSVHFEQVPREALRSLHCAGRRCIKAASTVHQRCAILFTKAISRIMLVFIRTLEGQGVVKRPIPETLSIMIHGALHLINLEVLEPKKVSSPIPIIFVNGFFGNSGGAVVLLKNLQEDGVREVFFANTGNPFRTIERHTETLRAKIQKATASAEKKQVILIGHSMGGNIAKYYRQHFADPDGVSVRLIITIASPLAGTEIARKASLVSQAARQLLPGSPLIQEQLAWKDEADQTQYVHIISNMDGVVRESRARGYGTEQVEAVQNIGHTAMLLSKQVCNIVVGRIHQVV